MSSGISHAQAQAQIREAFDDSEFIRLAHSRHPLATPANDLGSVESSHAMRRVILLLAPAPQQQQALRQFLDDVHNPHSASYHHWLTPEEFAAQYGPAEGVTGSLPVDITAQSGGLTHTATLTVNIQ